jgi:hypothetical protein
MSNNSEILTIQHPRAIVPRQKVLLFTRKKKKASSMKQANLKGMFKKALQECQYSNCCGYLLTPCLLVLQLLQLCRKHIR